MSNEEIKEILESLKNRLKNYEDARVRVCKLFGGEGEFTNATDWLIDELIDNTAKLIEDPSGWLNWFIYDCRWGESPMECVIDGEEFKPKTIHEFVEVLEKVNAK